LNKHSLFYEIGKEKQTENALVPFPDIREGHSKEKK